MELSEKSSVVVIPSLHPDNRLTAYTAELCRAGLWVIVVDDGSGADYAGIFKLIAQTDGCTVLRHETNLGKGCALKTAFKHLLEGKVNADFIVTADSDGQHTVEDVFKIKDRLTQNMRGVILGSRDFSCSIVPFKSRAGNHITSMVFRLLYGESCPDTQTGLRAFTAELLPFMMDVPGKRFEYEMNMLIRLTRSKRPIEHLPIHTVYENNNSGTHFQTIRDSARIYKVIFGNFFMFAFSSLLATGIDIAVYNVLLTVLFNAGQNTDFQRIAFSQTAARIISCTVNFFFNKHVVFNRRAGGKGFFLRYVALSVIILAASVGLVSLFKVLTGINERVLSLIINLTLFFISYRVQRQWVFREV